MYNTPITNNQALISFLSTSDGLKDQMAVGHLRYSTETKHTRSNMNLEKQTAVKQSEWEKSTPNERKGMPWRNVLFIASAPALQCMAYGNFCGGASEVKSRHHRKIVSGLSRWRALLIQHIICKIDGRPRGSGRLPMLTKCFHVIAP